MTKRSIITCEITGVDPKAYKNIDNVCKRSLGDYLKAEGYANTNVLAAASRLLTGHNGGNLWYAAEGARAISPSEAIKTVDANPALTASVKYGLLAKHILEPGTGTFLHYVFSQKDRELANAFFERLADGAELAKNHPVKQYRDALLSNKGWRTGGVKESPRKRWRRTDKLGHGIKAWNLLRGDNRVSRFRWNLPKDGSGFPVIL